MTFVAVAVQVEVEITVAASGTPLGLIGPQGTKRWRTLLSWIGQADDTSTQDVEVEWMV